MNNTIPKTLLTIALLIMIGTLVYLATNEYATERNTLEPPIPNNKYIEWKNFDDGLTYYYSVGDNPFNQKRETGIILENGKRVDCTFGIFMHGGVMAPECVEIILRHELDRRGL